MNHGLLGFLIFVVVNLTIIGLVIWRTLFMIRCFLQGLLDGTRNRKLREFRAAGFGEADAREELERYEIDMQKKFLIIASPFMVLIWIGLLCTIPVSWPIMIFLFYRMYKQMQLLKEELSK